MARSTISSVIPAATGETALLNRKGTLGIPPTFTRASNSRCSRHCAGVAHSLRPKSYKILTESFPNLYVLASNGPRNMGAVGRKGLKQLRQSRRGTHAQSARE